MRTLLLLFAVLAAAAGIAAPSASASCGYTTPAFTVNDVAGNPFNGQCLHWADTVRSDGTHTDWVQTGQSPWPAGWGDAFHAAQAQITFGPYRVPQYYNAAPGGPGCPNANRGDVPYPDPQGSWTVWLCYGSYSYGCPGTTWVACTKVWTYGEWDAASGRYWVGPHLYSAEVDFRSNPVDVDNNPVAWTTHLQKFAACHEIAGHGYGGSHTGSGAGGNPSWSASCLTAVNYTGTTPETLGSQVRADIGGWASHNDLAFNGWSNRYLAGLLRPFVPKPWAHVGPQKIEFKTKAQLRAIRKPAPPDTAYVTVGAMDGLVLGG